MNFSNTFLMRFIEQIHLLIHKYQLICQENIMQSLHDELSAYYNQYRLPNFYAESMPAAMAKNMQIRREILAA